MSTKPKEKSCKQRVRSHLRSRIDAIRDMFDRMQDDDDNVREQAMTDFSEYGLSLDYVEPGTFNNQPEGYIRYQLSWGGPSDEFRFFVNADNKHSMIRCEYWFMNWFDGAHITLSGHDFELISRVYDDFNDTGTVEHLIEKAAA